MLRNKRENAWFEKRRQEYCQLIRDVFDEYQQVLGAEKIQTILVQRGHQVSKEYVSRLMSEMGLRSVRMTAKKEYLKLREPERKISCSSNLLLISQIRGGSAMLAVLNSEITISMSA